MLQNLFKLRTLALCGILLNVSCQQSLKPSIEKSTDTPNVVIIYADDMGFGDLNCQNPNSKIPTPNLDQLASEGMRFTDAHSSSGICSPSRFAILTGIYHWRRQHGIVGAFGKPFFNEEDKTLADLLKTKGYATACIGKWHLGWNWDIKNPPSMETELFGKKRKVYGPHDINFNTPIKGGPLDRGFDYYFGDGTINFPPYAWIENDKFVEIPTENLTKSNIGYEVKEGHWEFRPGPKVKNWNPYKVLPTLTEKAVSWVKNQKKEQPFFLYFALPSPHAPIIPNDAFDGKSKAGAFGDFMVQTDWVAGQVLKALKEQGLEENTIVIFSADNGPEIYAFERAEKYDHFSMGAYRGLKRDVWEGGHHVPFIVKWPRKIKPNSVSNELISQIDVFATIANITGAKIPENIAGDSYNFTDTWLGNTNKITRPSTVHNTKKNNWGLRKGDWLYISSSTGSHSKMPASFKKLRGYKEFETDGLLFNLKEDPEQRINLFTVHPEIVAELKIELNSIQQNENSAKR